jgi:hypothetical protein
MRGRPSAANRKEYPYLLTMCFVNSLAYVLTHRKITASIRVKKGKVQISDLTQIDRFNIGMPVIMAEQITQYTEFRFL